jgi:hypothetical protein
MYRSRTWIWIWALLVATSASGQLDHISYQGALLDAGVPYDGTAQFKFAVVSSAGATLWSHDGTSSDGSQPASSIGLEIDRGVFAVLLGQNMVPLTADAIGLATDPVLRVWVDVGAGFVQLGDQPLSGSAFALQSDAAKRALGNFQVAGELQVNAGIRFPDNSVQTSAAGGSGSWAVSGNTQYSTVTGGVGIGTSSPLDLLHLQGASSYLRINSEPINQGSSGIRISEGNQLRWSWLFRGWMNDDLLLRDEVSGLDVMSLRSNTGNIGIGVASPAERLAIGNATGNTFFSLNGNASMSTGIVYNDAGTARWNLLFRNWQNDNLHVRDAMLGSDIVTFESNTQNVGFGNTDPEARLDLLGGRWNLATGEGDFRIGNGTHRLKMGVATSGGGAGDSYIRAQGGSNRLLLGSDAQNKLIVQDSGVQVVNGTLTTPVITITGGADIAEPFPTSCEGAIEPGSVLIIDEQEPGRLALSTRAYDTRVAGVVSGAGGVRPGLTLDQEKGGLDAYRSGTQSNVALTGRVYVRASAENGPIQPGDLLTSSNEPGLAMRATDRDRWPGAVLGKAMSSLEQGTGLILALVNLQ